MPELRAFRGIRFSTIEELKNLWCPPYDIISAAEQDALHERHPHNAVRLELAKAGGPAGYSNVASLFASWLDEGVLSRDPNPSLYVYRQDFTGPDRSRRRVVGTIGALALEEFGTDSGVLPHERTMPGPIEDRLALLEALGVNVSPIYSIYRGKGELEPFYEGLEDRPTQGRFADDQGILHRLWVISAPAEVEMLTRAVGARTQVIADGHHRYETALTFHRHHIDEPGEHDTIMCFCVDADAAGLVVLPYNRALGLPPDTDIGAAIANVGGLSFDPTPERALAASGADHPFVFVSPDEEWVVEVGDDELVNVVGDRAPAWRSLDVVALHEALLPRMFPAGIEEMSFSRDPDEIYRLVRKEGWDVGVLLRALEPAQIVDVARSGERMPQKASYFWPKAVTGLVFRSMS